MGRVGIEINDAGIVLADASAVRAVEPGYAQADQGQVLLGEAARKAARLRPRKTSLRFWDELALDAGSDAIDGFASTAELAHKQLDHIWQQYGDAAQSAVLVTPAHFDRDKLALLLGIAQESNIAVTGLVPAAVAVAAAPYPEGQLLHLDFSLHRALLSQLSQSNDKVSLAGSEARTGLGLNDLWDRIAHRMAELFISQTRFDPFHQAASEQSLFDALPDWLERLRMENEVEATLEFSGDTFAVTVDEASLVSAVDGHYRALAQWIAAAREPGATLLLLVSERILGLPGLKSRLENMADVRLELISTGAAAQAVAAMDAFVPTANGSVALTQALAWRAAALVFDEVVAPDSPRGPEPTRLVLDGIAYAVGNEGLSIGRGVVPGKGLAISGRGISTEHCRVERRGTALWLVDRSRYGTFVNDKRVSDAVLLASGDVIRLGSPGVEVLVVAMAEDVDGA